MTPRTAAGRLLIAYWETRTWTHEPPDDIVDRILAIEAEAGAETLRLRDALDQVAIDRAIAAAQPDAARLAGLVEALPEDPERLAPGTWRSSCYSCGRPRILGRPVHLGHKPDCAWAKARAALAAPPVPPASICSDHRPGDPCLRETPAAAGTVERCGFEHAWGDCGGQRGFWRHTREIAEAAGDLYHPFTPAPPATADDRCACGHDRRYHDGGEPLLCDCEGDGEAGLCACPGFMPATADEAR